MKHRLTIEILPQPNLTTCGPTCLHAVYRFHGDEQSLSEVIARAARFPNGGTLAVMLALDALQRGYGATIHTFNLTVFDPTWFQKPGIDLVQKLRKQVRAKPDDHKLEVATRAYIEFIEAGGTITWADLTPELLCSHLQAGRPLLTGLSSTYLYQEARETQDEGISDDVAGSPAGHFVVLSGYDPETRSIRIADPLADNPMSEDHHYTVPIGRAICAILLGVLTYDANFLTIEPPPNAA